MSGGEAIARAAVESGVSVVTSYPGSPATYVVNGVMNLSEPGEVQVEWTSNEKVAMEIAFGASLGGKRALLAVKSVGLNIALDALMTMNLSGCNAGFVILVGDDPGSWGSQNEQDSRALAELVELPWFEPATTGDAYAAMCSAFALSEEMGLPVVVRITRALALARAEREALEASALRDGGLPIQDKPPSFQREFMRWVVLPINVVEYHDRLLERLGDVRDYFETSPLNGVVGDGSWGIIAAGFAYQKLLDTLGGRIPPDVKLLRLGTLYPFPESHALDFLRTVESALVLEETVPVVERAIRATAQSGGLTLPVYGRDTGHVPRTGELFAADLAEALNRFLPYLDVHGDGISGRARPSREVLCEGCPYIPIFDALMETMEKRGGREAFIVVGDPGCMVRGQLPPYQLLDVKHGLGASIGMATGLARAQTGKRIIALVGDSGFLHTGINGLFDAARTGARMLVLILDNGTTALSGGQPHPGSTVNARGAPRRAVDLAGLAREAGAQKVTVVNIDRGEEILGPIEEGVDFDGLAVVVARGRCVLY
jgi:indolepyruvate ferredoxin oxidoreductase alpha subunit